MKWLGRRGSDNVEDQRSGGGGFGGLPIPLTGGGILLVLVISLLMGRNPLELLSGGGGGAPVEQSAPAQAPPESDSAARFVSVVLADTEAIWGKLFQQAGKEYRQPRLVLFRSRVQSGCGGASSSTGPFYCPADEKVYIDLSFYDDLHHRLGAPGDFAMAYVIAHEVGHHVQNLLGTTERVQRDRSSGAESASVRLELQADYYAGVWAHYEDEELGAVEVGDIDEALNAASAVGDDRLQQQSGGDVVPDAFTHGTSAQRQAWFRKGLESGDPAGGDTFAAQAL